MEENFKKKPLAFNDRYDSNLIDSEYYRVLNSHLKEIYPLVYKALSEASLLEAYLEPKIVLFFEREIEHRKNGLPLHGIKELAYNDIFEVLKDELQDNEKIEFTNQFDLDVHPFIDTEEI
ncbi:hypothetical protein [uncultured Flavobacterium sp.]|uniref:hypothetical protein n=1 Tax=uncultured Flavobacterium sp. TaxID=165435 RepID=UPI002598145B|nr:hypothetical protein [uncultured Flavobacterium sp.]